MLTIKNWAEDDRPREKLLSRGASALSDAELLAVIIATGTRDESAVELSRRVLSLADNSLVELGRLGVRELQQLKGVGQAKACGIAAALELGRRRRQGEALERNAIRCSKDIADYFAPLLSDLPHEELWVLMLSTRLHVLGAQRVAQGGVEGVAVDMRVLLKPCIERLATSIAVAHNHPSGTCKPSEHDQLLTNRVQHAADLVGIKLADHVIVAGGAYFSFADEGLLA